LFTLLGPKKASMSVPNKASSVEQEETRFVIAATQSSRDDWLVVPSPLSPIGIPASSTFVVTFWHAMRSIGGCPLVEQQVANDPQ